MTEPIKETYTSEDQKLQAEAFAADEPYIKDLLLSVAETGPGALAEHLGQGTVAFREGYVTVAGMPWAVALHNDGACSLLYQAGPEHPADVAPDYLAQLAPDGEFTFWPTDHEQGTPWTRLSGSLRTFAETVGAALA